MAFQLIPTDFPGQNKASFVNDHDASILPVTITSSFHLLHIKEDIENITGPHFLIQNSSYQSV